MFITSFLMGGLGNQMFQIAKALSEGYENNIEVFFKPVSYIPMHGNQPSKYLNNIFRNVVFKNFDVSTERIYEQTWAYKKIDVMYFRPVEYYGYFQSSKNFGHHSEKIKEVFKPTEEFIENIKTKYPQAFEKNSTSIHVRRGDYLTIQDILPVVDKTYIDKCVGEIENIGPILIFSNDKEWVRNNLNYKNSIIIDGLEDYKELWLMSLCQNNILSNSSFSWWGSYLNKNRNKKTFVPSIWFGPNGEKNYEDIYENEWNKINVKYSNGTLICE